MADIVILIVTWNAARHLRRCLQSLTDFPATAGPPAGILVLDNASSDDSAGLVAREFPAVRLVANARNVGFAAAVNQGLALTCAPYVLLLNSDVEARAGAIDRLAAYLDAHPEVGAAGGRLLDREGRPQRGFNVRRFPTLAVACADLLLLDKLAPHNRVTRRYLYADRDPGVSGAVDQPAAACLMLRRRAMEVVGGLDERFTPAWFEDVDLCKRLAAAGWEVHYVAEAECRHAGGASLEHLAFSRFSTVWYRNLEYYFRKHHGRLAWMAVKGLVWIGMLVRLAVATVRPSVTGHSRRDALAAYAAVLRGSLTGWKL